MTARHGSESFFIEGEGLVNTQVGGRRDDERDPITELRRRRGRAGGAPIALAEDEAPPFRFSRVGPKGTAVRPRPDPRSSPRR